MEVLDIFEKTKTKCVMEFKETKYFDELFTDEEIYAEMYPTFDQVQAEVINNPNKRKTHQVSANQCVKHKTHMRIYHGVRGDGRVYTTVLCPYCRAERKKEIWKIKLKGNLEKS